MVVVAIATDVVVLKECKSLVAQVVTYNIAYVVEYFVGVFVVWCL